MLAVTHHRHRLLEAGVTLLELAIVLAIVGILAVLAVPSIIDRWQRETVELLAQRLASTISLAEVTAQGRHVQTRLRPRENRDWAMGWELIELPPGTTDESKGRILITVSLPTIPAVSLGTNLRSSPLSYEAVGYLRMSGVNGATLTFVSGRHQRSVVINPAGKARICDPTSDPDNCRSVRDSDP